MVADCFHATAAHGFAHRLTAHGFAHRLAQYFRLWCEITARHGIVACLFAAAT